MTPHLSNIHQKEARNRDGSNCIQADTVYPLEVFYKLTGLEKAAVRKMRGKGFAVRRIGRRSYIIGSDFLSYCDAQPAISA